MTILDIIQLTSSVLFLVAAAYNLRQARNCRKARIQYQSKIDQMKALERGVPFQ